VLRSAPPGISAHADTRPSTRPTAAGLRSKARRATQRAHASERLKSNVDGLPCKVNYALAGLSATPASCARAVRTGAGLYAQPPYYLEWNGVRNAVGAKLDHTFARNFVPGHHIGHECSWCGAHNFSFAFGNLIARIIIIL